MIPVPLRLPNDCVGQSFAKTAKPLRNISITPSNASYRWKHPNALCQKILPATASHDHLAKGVRRAVSNLLRASSSEYLLGLALFCLFIGFRIVAFAWPSLTFGLYGDSYQYYVPAGLEYISGRLPSSLNPEHPPLAKYIIGFFALYSGGPVVGTILFSAMSGGLAFLLSRKLTSNSRWALVAVWFMAFDQVNILISSDPMLEIFMLFFALLGVYCTLTATRPVHFAATGLMLGFAVACKWSGLSFLLGVLLFFIINHKYLAWLLVSTTACAAYLFSYAVLIIEKGFGSFFDLQIWMLKFMSSTHPVPNDMILRAFSWVIFHSTTFAWVLGYDPSLHPEAFSFLGAHFISFVNEINPTITLLIFPVLFWQLHSYRSQKQEAAKLMLLILITTAVGELAFVRTEPWLYSPLDAIVSIMAPSMLLALADKGRMYRVGVYTFLALVAIWPIIHVYLHLRGAFVF